MVKLNIKPKNQTARAAALRLNSHETHGGAPAAHIGALAQLRRSVMSCLLWEDEHYESGEKIADRIARHAAEVTPSELAAVAADARHIAKLRHVPLWLLVTLLKTAKGQRSLIVDAIDDVIQRADEPGELLAMYWKTNGKDAPLSNPLKLGLAKALLKFDAYQLAKYAKQGDVRLRDVMFLTHPVPDLTRGPAGPELFRQLAEDELSPTDAGTWEAELSAGADKRETFERLIREDKLGYLALLRNLRNMSAAGCDPALVNAAIVARRGADRVFPFRFIAAARHAPAFAPALNESMLQSVANLPKLPGTTAVLVDVSGSMSRPLGGKSDLIRIDAACALAVLVPAETVRVLSFSSGLVECQNLTPGLPGIEEIKRSQPHSSTKLFEAVQTTNERIEYDRIIVISDEQATYGYSAGIETDSFPAPRPGAKAYMINVASARNGVGYGNWTHIDGFSENVIRYIAACEAEG